MRRVTSHGLTSSISFFSGMAAKHSTSNHFISSLEFKSILERYESTNPHLWQRVTETLEGKSADDLFTVGHDLARAYEGPKHADTLEPVHQALLRLIEDKIYSKIP